MLFLKRKASTSLVNGDDMAAGKSVADILASAKDTLKHAEDFTKSAGGVPSTVAPKHEYSDASYSMVKKPAPPKDYSLADEAHSAGEGIKARL
jgi:hypothetical protein